MGWLTQLLKGKKVAGKALKKYTPTKHEKFMMKDPYERAAIISRRESAKRGDVYTGTSVVGTPSPHRSAKAIKKYSGPHSYQLTDPARKRRGPHAKGGRIGFAEGKYVDSEYYKQKQKRKQATEVKDVTGKVIPVEKRPHSTYEGRSAERRRGYRRESKKWHKQAATESQDRNRRTHLGVIRKKGGKV